jgi:hypothetical protein
MTQPATDAVIRSASQPVGEPPAPEQKVAEPTGGNGGAAFAEASVGLLRKLAGSLQSSQRALLSRDLAGIEQHTGEQIRLRRALEILWSQNLPQASDPMPFDSMLNDPTPYARAGASELRLAQMRVLHLGRIQAALLTRAQRRARMLSHLFAGPGANYTPPAYNWLAERGAWSRAGRGRTRTGQEESGPEKERSQPENPEERHRCRV